MNWDRHFLTINGIGTSHNRARGNDQKDINRVMWRWCILVDRFVLSFVSFSIRENVPPPSERYGRVFLCRMCEQIFFTSAIKDCNKCASVFCMLFSNVLHDHWSAMISIFRMKYIQVRMVDARYLFKQSYEGKCCLLAVRRADELTALPAGGGTQRGGCWQRQSSKVRPLTGRFGV